MDFEQSKEPPLLPPEELLHNPILRAYTSLALLRYAEETGLTTDELSDSQLLATTSALEPSLRNTAGTHVSWDEASLRHTPNPPSAARTTDPEAVIEHAELQDVLNRILSTLSWKAASVLRLRHGLDNEREAHTYRKIGKAVGISVHHARTLTWGTLSNLRNSEHSQNLREYLQGEVSTADEATPKPCEDAFADISVPVYDRYDSRLYLVRLEEACESWKKDQPILTKDLVPDYLYREVAALLKPDFLYIHDTRAHNTNEAQQHYNDALARIKHITRRINNHVSNPWASGITYDDDLAMLLVRKIITTEDVPYMFDINISDPHSREKAINQYIGLSLQEIRNKLVETMGLYRSYQSQIRKNPESFWRRNHRRITRIYNKDTLFAAVVARVYADYARQLEILRLTKKRILNRPRPPGTEAATKASLMVLDTKIAYYEHLTEAGRQQSSDQEWFAVLPQEI